ncbi:MAG: hypothetical protein JWM75_1311 [Sphingomonas bacterium]|nr:hypothetical protein [Sphingomonas bacterium]
MITRLHGRMSALAAVATLALSGCATQRLQAPAPIAAAVVPPPPAPPPGISAGLVVPPVGPDGAYLTINHGIDAAQTLWHVRSALNVAALACRGQSEADLIAAYNGLLRTQKAPLATALRAMETRWKAERGKDWQTQYDIHMTRLYNFFAQPAAQAGFCHVASAVAAESAMVPPAELTQFAQTALPRLEAPFTAVYRSYDGYRRDLAAWQARFGDGIVAPAGAPAPQLAYAGLDALLQWDAREVRVRTASR